MWKVGSARSCLALLLTLYRPRACTAHVLLYRYGFLTAMGSNLAFQSRNVISKKFMQDRCVEGGNVWNVGEGCW